MNKLLWAGKLPFNLFFCLFIRFQGMIGCLALAVICLLLTRVLNPYLFILISYLSSSKATFINIINNILTANFALIVVVSIFLLLTANILIFLSLSTFLLSHCFHYCGLYPKNFHLFQEYCIFSRIENITTW